MEWWVISTLGILLVMLLLELAYGVYRHGIGPTPSGRAARDLIVQICRSKQSMRDQSQIDLNPVHNPKQNPPQPLTIYELGSGWGGLAYTLVKSLSRQAPQQSISVVGYEITRMPYLVSKVLELIFQYLHPHPEHRLRYNRDDLLVALKCAQDGDLLVCYLCPTQMMRISEYLRNAEHLPALTLVSLTFALPDFTPSESYTLPTFYRDQVYVYQLSDTVNSSKVKVS